MTRIVKIDQLGRFSLPKVIRDRLKINEATLMEIFIDGDSIILQKQNKNNTCIVTGGISDPSIKTSTGMSLSTKGAKILLEDLLHLYHSGDI